MHLKRSLIPFMLFVVFAAACGGGHLASTPDLSAASNGAASSKASAVLSAEDLAQLADLAANPGVSGVDYDPRSITVYYPPIVQLPALLAGAPAATGERAAAQGNAILRHNKQYEPLTDAIAARYGLRITSQVYLEQLNMAGFSVPPATDSAKVLDDLRREFAGSLVYAGYSQYFQHCAAVNDTDYVNSSTTGGPQWGHRRIRCAEAFDFTTGDPAVRIAVVDTGVRITHQELKAQVLDPAVAFPAFNLDVANNDNTVDDSEGHGTFIAGLIASQVNNNRTLAGAAYNCQVIPIKITNGGSAMDQDIYEGCLLADQLGAKAINLSFGDTHNDPNLEVMVNQIVSHGHLFVGAAGNNNSETIEYPSGYTNSLCVGATQYAQDDTDTRASFSNYGSWVDIAAPGEYLKSCTPDKDNGYNSWMDGSGSGTSFAAPLVAAAAGLLWSYKSTLTVSEVRNFLVTTGAPTIGFNNSAVLRLDMAAALTAVNTLKLFAPEPTRLIQHGAVSLQADVSITPDSVDCYVDGVLRESKTTGPFTFNIDTSGITFGKASVTFVAHRGADTSTDSIDLLIDNTAGAYPLQEDFESGGEYFKGIDAKSYNLGLLQSLKTLSSGWTQDQIARNGLGQWNLSPTGGYQSANCARMGTPANTYGTYETDALVSRLIDFSAVAKPTLTFYQHYNIEDGGSAKDRGYVCVTDDYGQTFTVMPLKSGVTTRFTGYLADYALTEVNLEQFKNKKVHVLLVFESDGQDAGNQAGPAGWWVDHLVLSANYSTSLPIMTGVSLPSWSVYGSVPQRTTLTVAPQGVQGVARVVYLLDMAPVDTIAPPDISLNVTTAPFTGVINLPNVPNQLAQLHVRCYDAGNTAGPEFTVPLYLFNLAGDANADNAVNQLDTDLINSKLGLGNTDAGFSPFCDSNFDRTITELDGAAVGYYWGASI
jgi:hypothetical protein